MWFSLDTEHTCKRVRLRLRGHDASSIVMEEPPPPTTTSTSSSSIRRGREGGEIGRAREECGVGVGEGGRGHTGWDYREGLVM